MKWMLVTWYIAGGFTWTHYEFPSKKTCEDARKVMVEHHEFTNEYYWFCVYGK